MSIWVLGATGRSGRRIATELQRTGHPVTLAGRDQARLATLAEEIGTKRFVTGTFDGLLDQLGSARPDVVVNAVGPFADTAARVVRACSPGTHYVDIGNEIGGFTAVLDRDTAARSQGSTFVVGAGYGVVATESCAIRVCEGMPAPASLRVDAIPSLANEAGVVGEALAGSILGEAPQGGRRVRGGELVRYGFGSDPLRLTTPDGDRVVSTVGPTGDLLAAWRTSDAESVLAGNSEIPSGPVVRAAFPALSFALRSAGLRRFAIGRLAAVKVKPGERPRRSSWGRAEATWRDGGTRVVWLRLGDAQEVTAAAAAEVARRLADGKGKPGAHTPGALFGADLAASIGCEFMAGSVKP